MSEGGRWAITGMGAVCGAGLTVESILDAVVAGRSAVGPIRTWDATGWPTGVAAEVVGVDPRTLVEDRKLHKTISRTDLFGLYAARQAIEGSGLHAYRAGLEAEAARQFNDRSGVFAGSGGGAYRTNYDYLPLMAATRGELGAFGRQLGETVNPMWLLRSLPNNVLCHVGIRHGFRGTNACITNHCVGGLMAVVEAAAAIRNGEADRAVAVGHDAPFEPESQLHYQRVGLLTSEAVRPFDVRRDGTAFGEGAAAVVLERWEEAEARGATIWGEFLGAGCTTEGLGVLEIREDGDGLARALEMALAEARVGPESVGMIVAHGNGGRGSDASEAAAFRRVFGERVPPVTAFKWAVGHLVAASGILDFALGLLAMRRGLVPGVGTLTQLDPALAWMPVSVRGQVPRSEVGVVCCRGFGGMNLVAVVRVRRAGEGG